VGDGKKGSQERSAGTPASLLFPSSLRVPPDPASHLALCSRLLGEQCYLYIEVTLCRPLLAAQWSLMLHAPSCRRPHWRAELIAFTALAWRSQMTMMHCSIVSSFHLDIIYLFVCVQFCLVIH
jgi:hypothetical protein